jgi:uncharacterized membrane protein
MISSVLLGFDTWFSVLLLYICHTYNWFIRIFALESYTLYNKMSFVYRFIVEFSAQALTVTPFKPIWAWMWRESKRFTNAKDTDL